MRWNLPVRHDTWWGKLTPYAAPHAEWHPVIDHCVDVAATAEALLSVSGIARPLARLAGRLAFDEVTIARVSVIVGLHDLGKFNHWFQNKAMEGENRTAGHVTEALNLLGSLDPAVDDTRARERRAAAVTRRAYAAIELPLLCAWGASVPRLLPVAICHHGKPVKEGRFADMEAKNLWEPRGDRDPLAAMAGLMRVLRASFPAAFAGDAPPLPDAPGFEHAFAGLVSLADWVGSDKEVFPYSEADDPPRIERARAYAARVLAETFLDPARARRARPAPPPFSEVTGRVTPRAAQRATLGLSADPGPTLVVLESETGSGKTESAFLRYASLFCAGEVDGMYFALPTRAAAVQIHARIRQLALNTFGAAAPPVVLAVPGFLRVDDAQGTRPLTGFDVLWNDDNSERARFRYWAGEGPKRFLAGAIVVGTVDQVLLSALQVPHAHLRAAALLRHLLVIDEVHASDAYMNRVLEEVLRHHVAAGGHALLMSATLGANARAAYLSLTPGRAIIARPTPTLAEAIGAAYPLLSYRVGGGPAECVPVVHEGVQKAVSVVAFAIASEPAVVAARALAAAETGACVLVIRNTVRDCVETQEALEALAGGDSPLLFRCAGVAAPHHSRFAPEDRRALDSALEAAFKARRPFVVVATQTVQQSLDIDADLLLTDLCPMDVMLQRIGRLHRHAHSRRVPGFAAARCEVLVPSERDLGARLDAKGQVRQKEHGLGSVYRDLRILEATWRLVEQRPVWSIPQDNRALVEESVHPDALAAIADGRAAWVAHGNEVLGKELAGRSSAKLNLVDWNVHFQEMLFPAGDDARDISTRLDDDEGEDRLVDLPAPVSSPFGHRLAQLRIPRVLVRGLATDAVVETVELAGDAVVVGMSGGLAYRYGRWGMGRE
ncbi:MAG: CRISPR-associated helicase Cas3' [Pseudomonadota bacterium]|nr:CRISPR-associated helicase Cas3' [Pseudomonadota bacterium]